jgi:hypothetical protein
VSLICEARNLTRPSGTPAAVPAQWQRRAVPLAASEGVALPLAAMANNVVLLAATAMLATSAIVWVSDTGVPRVECGGQVSSWLERREQAAHLEHLTEQQQQPLPLAAALSGTAADARRRVGWRSGVLFAKFGEPGQRHRYHSRQWAHPP